MYKIKCPYMGWCYVQWCRVFMVQLCIWGTCIHKANAKCVDLNVSHVQQHYLSRAQVCFQLQLFQCCYIQWLLMCCFILLDWIYKQSTSVSHVYVWQCEDNLHRGHWQWYVVWNFTPPNPSLVKCVCVCVPACVCMCMRVRVHVCTCACSSILSICQW